VSAAATALPPNHGAVSSVEFHYGAYCDSGGVCPLSTPKGGYVVFTTELDGTPARVIVPVEGDAGGRAIALGSPITLPTH